MTIRSLVQYKSLYLLLILELLFLEDYNITFRGKTDDCFRIGIKLTKKSLRLYSAFYESDIIIASPLGLRTIIGVDGDAKRDFDFLSSISLCVMDQTDIIAMQNWEHVTTLFQHLNLIPTKPRDCDFSRIKEEYLDGKGSTIRQTVFLSKYPFPELNALTSTYFSNAKGSSIIALPLVDIKVTKLSKNIKLGCHKLNPNSLEASADYRFYWFSKNMDSILEQGHCIYVASYFDFVRLKNLFTANELSFAAISE